MAPPPPSPQASNTPKPGADGKDSEANVPEGGKHSKAYSETRDKLLKMLNATTPEPFPGTLNSLGTYFTIRTDRPVPEFNTKLARAFEAEDSRDHNKRIYALVLDKKMPPRIAALKALQDTAIPHFANALASGVVELDRVNGRRFTVIYERPKGRTLSSIMKERGKPLPENFVIEQILIPLTRVLHHFGQHSLAHGRINPENIYFSESVMLGECFIEPCGYSQPFLFEPPNRAQAHPAGKGEGMHEDDCFSLGLLAAYLCIGNKAFAALPNRQDYILNFLKTDSYSLISQQFGLGELMVDFLRGTLNNNLFERWTYEQLNLWAKGRRFNMLQPAPPPTASREFDIAGHQITNMRQLSQGMAMGWDNAIQLMNDGSPGRWVDMSARRRDISELLNRAYNALGGNSARNKHQSDELVGRAITILDPLAPLTMKETRALPAGIGSVIAEGFHSDEQQHINNGIDMIEMGLPTVWADMYRREDMEPPGDSTNTLWLLDRMRMILRMPGYGFGAERLIYDLNPHLPCLSPLLGDHQAFTLTDLFLTLNRTATEKARSEIPLDRHIAAFIAHKLTLSKESILSEYTRMPKLARHPALIALRLFEQAHISMEHTPRVKALTLWVAINVIDAVEHFHSKTIREQMYLGLERIADRGLFNAMTGFVNQKEFAGTDIEGFGEAIESYHKINEEIAKLKNQQYLKKKASKSGYSIAKYIAHVGLLLVALYLLQDNFLR